MTRHKLIGFIFTIFALGVTISGARAQDDFPPENDDQRPPAQRLRRPNLLQTLNLSREQVQQIRAINQSQKPLRQAAQFRLREANRALDRAVYAEMPNESEIQTRMKDVQLAQTEVIRIRTETEFAIRKILTPEQLVKFRELRERFTRRLENRRNQTNQPAPIESRPVSNPARPPLNRQSPRRGF